MARVPGPIMLRRSQRPPDYVAGLILVGRHMLRTLSARQTFLMKVIFPTLWIAGFGIGTLLLFLRSADANGNPPPEHVKWQFLVLWLAGTGFIWWGCVRLKRVRVDDALL